MCKRHESGSQDRRDFPSHPVTAPPLHRRQAWSLKPKKTAPVTTGAVDVLDPTIS